MRGRRSLSDGIRITSHVLDLTSGRPAAGVGIVLEGGSLNGAWRELGQLLSDTDGRVQFLLPSGSLAAGHYRLRFETAPYFAVRGVTPFHPVVEVVFTLTDETTHCHVPLLLGPFGYTTYRGS